MFAPEIEAGYHDGALLLDVSRHEVYLIYRREKVELTPTQFRLLMVLVRNAGIVLTTERLLELVWGDAPIGPENLRKQISTIRRKLKGVGIQLIETVREFGYRYNPPRD